LHTSGQRRTVAMAAILGLLVAADVGLGDSIVTEPVSPRQAAAAPPPVPSAPPADPIVNALHLPPTNANTTVVSLTFDDGLTDQYALRTLLPAYHLTATVYANSGLLADRGYVGRMSLYGLYDLARNGVEIGGHTAHHPDLAELPTATAREEICGDRDQLRAWGFDVVSFAYPSSSSDPAVRRIPAECGYLSARSVGGDDCPGCSSAETFPPRDRYSLRTPDAVEWRTSLRELEQEVIAAENQATATGVRTWLILNFHHICDRCNKYAITQQHLAALMDWLTRRPATTAVRAVGAVMLHGFQ
jgi:peptidoglycan/xylan/chitin deacetylase (PgdA/CDA1 family)